MKDTSGIGVLDKVVTILDQLGKGAATLPEITRLTAMPKPTAHRLLQGLVHHGVIERDTDGRYIIGPVISVWAASGGTESLIVRARPQLDALRDATGLSAQLYVRSGDDRLCVAVSEPASGLRDTVPIGALLTLQAGSAAQVLLAWSRPEELAAALKGAAFTGSGLEEVRKAGFAQSAGEREPGVASVSAPIWKADRVCAAISVSGPLDRMTNDPGQRYSPLVLAAGAALCSES